MSCHAVWSEIFGFLLYKQNIIVNDEKNNPMEKQMIKCKTNFAKQVTNLGGLQM